jgi:beta-lysine 5,6-aminomutase alpha subunit
MPLSLGIPIEKIERAREHARSIADKVQSFILERTTDSVERATLRLMGLDGVGHDGVPLPNVLVESLKDRLAGGVSAPVIGAMLAKNLDINEIARAVDEGAIDLNAQSPVSAESIDDQGAKIAALAMRRISETVSRRDELLSTLSDPPKPWIYVIVATGNIHEDIVQARMAARQGADIIAVIRSTGQSLLDFVPFGATTEGFGGTYATQENFRLMRAALDDVGSQIGHYIRLVNYASGLCMPEIAAMGAIERQDMMLNDSMYGILFRDINPNRTFVDQYTSRLITARARIIINTGEDNYLTTADAVEAAHTVLASCLLNERFAQRAGLTPDLMGLGHAFEIDPDVPDSLSLETAHALVLREVFPEHPLKYMPPTKHMTGDVFRGFQMNALFNLVGVTTGQGIQLLGMLTEAMHTPYLMDRALAIQNAKYAFTAARNFAESFDLRPGGMIVKRAHFVMDRTIEMLERIADIGLFAAIEEGMFADIKRPRDGGKGASGVYVKSPDYYNPIMDALEKS